MPNQFLFVEFPETRTVLSGGTEVGDTNSLLTINAGTHTITLDDPQDYQPTSRKVVIAGTSVAKPLVLSFTNLVVALKPPLRKVRRTAKRGKK